MATSKLNREDAQEWLESLQQVGEGWWRQVALAVRAGAHKALGMERREFAQAIGQRMIDSRSAILELHGEGHSMAAIADVLSVSEHTVKNVLIEEGLVQGEITVKASGPTKASIAAASSDAEKKTAAASSEDLQAQIDALTAQVKGEKTKAKREKKELKDEMAALRKSITEEKRRLRDEAEELLTKEERERASKEAEAWAHEQSEKLLVGMSHLVIDSIVGSLEEAAGELRLLIQQDAITDKGIEAIDSAHAGFMEEFNVARMSAGVA